VKNLEIDKAQVALRFAQAGQSYSEHAVVQKQIARQLFNLIQSYAVKTQFERVFEIGCGSGNLSHLLLKEFQISHAEWRISQFLFGVRRFKISQIEILL